MVRNAGSWQKNLSENEFEPFDRGEEVRNLTYRRGVEDKLGLIVQPIDKTVENKLTIGDDTGENLVSNAYRTGDITQTVVPWHVPSYQLQHGVQYPTGIHRSQTHVVGIPWNEKVKTTSPA